MITQGARLLLPVGVFVLAVAGALLAVRTPLGLLGLVPLGLLAAVAAQRRSLRVAGVAVLAAVVVVGGFFLWLFQALGSGLESL